MSPDDEPLKPVDRMRIRVAAEGYRGYKTLEDTHLDDDVTMEMENTNSNNNSSPKQKEDGKHDEGDDRKRKLFRAYCASFLKITLLHVRPYVQAFVWFHSKAVDEVLEQVRPAHDTCRCRHVVCRNRAQRQSGCSESQQQLIF